ncbi:von Willebrand factor A domain-containing protein 7-like [Cheilinus undulatus]|uniref:von Willebrand factor A domain-containing protein 7-like n=1 Tax=Cheilinus undulatus TaxID=241271 RepID=UPI001BD2B350|nr:von Willebrand factor A domain-containing protein 7-like [Cheilinus undulatus]
MSPLLSALCLLILHTGVQSFGILPGDSLNHQEITERAILNVTVLVCHDLAAAEGADFSFPPYTAESVAVACGTPKSTKSFRRAITFITLMNVRVDLRHALNASFHFDEEMFDQGRGIITAGLDAVKASNEQERYEAARQKLGEILHPIQDFYSHSDWLELGFKVPNSNLLRSDTSIGNIAEESRPTCRNCDGDDCKNNILEDIIQEKVLTSGYFGVVPGSSTKPPGKCSHGGAVDQTSTIEPKGGINKDTFSASHGHLHTQAANLAIAATSELLQEIRKAAGDRPFLQMLGLTKGSNKDLCFVVDTTNSMSDVIDAVNNVTSFIINSEEGTENEPAAYILVPFNDPDVGPVIRTTDPGIIQAVFESLIIGGGGDEGELSLSGLELALRAAPSNSEIFLFTDAPAKDKGLKNSILTLIERTQTVVNIMISGTTSNNRRRRRAAGQSKNSRITDEDIQLYRELCQASGGQTVEVTKTELPEAASIISDTLNSSVVTLVQAARNPGKEDVFSFIIDESITDLTVHVTGRSVTFILTSPTGESQESTDATGSLITSRRSVGNLQSVKLKKVDGLWEVRMVSTNPYTLKVIGQSPIDFLFDFVKKSQGPFEGYDSVNTRLRAGVNGSLLVSLTGSNTATVTEAVLLGSWSSEEIEGIVEPQGSGSFLVHFSRMPSDEFVVQVKGRDDSFESRASIFFQRVVPTTFKTSDLMITADADSIIVPTAPFEVPFSVMAHSKGGNFTIRATNSRLFDSTFPTSLVLTTGIPVNGTVTLTAPRTTPSGTDVTLNIEAESPDRQDVNYVMLRFTVINPITDFIHPECVLLSRQSNCSQSCHLSEWTINVRVQDGAEGTGVDSVRLRAGNGTLYTNPAANNENITMVFYRSSCCSPDMELQVEDKIGNTGTCSFSFNSNPTNGATSTKATKSTLLCLSMVVFWVYVLT